MAEAPADDHAAHPLPAILGALPLQEALVDAGVMLIGCDVVPAMIVVHLYLHSKRHGDTPFLAIPGGIEPTIA